MWCARAEFEIPKWHRQQSIRCTMEIACALCFNWLELKINCNSTNRKRLALNCFQLAEWTSCTRANEPRPNHRKTTFVRAKCFRNKSTATYINNELRRIAFNCRIWMSDAERLSTVVVWRCGVLNKKCWSHVKMDSVLSQNRMNSKIVLQFLHSICIISEARTAYTSVCQVHKCKSNAMREESKKMNRYFWPFAYRTQNWKIYWRCRKDWKSETCSIASPCCMHSKYEHTRKKTQTEPTLNWRRIQTE